MTARLRPESAAVELDDQPSGLGWLPSGDLLVVAMTTRQVRRVDADGQVHLGRIEAVEVDVPGAGWP